MSGFAAGVAELLDVLEGAGLPAWVALDGSSVATTPAVVVTAPVGRTGRRTAAGGAVFDAEVDVVVVPGSDALLDYLDRVLEVLRAGGVLVVDVAPTVVAQSDAVNASPAYRITVSWPVTFPSTP